MKKIKTKLIALLVCIITIAFTLTGCGIFVKDNTKAMQQKAIKVGTTVLSQEEVVNLWYSFYTENSNYFYYYGEDAILDMFYKNVVLKYAVLQEFNNLKADGKTFYTNQDEAEVWNDVFEYIAGQIDTFEKALYTEQGVKNSGLPTRLQSSAESSESEVKSYLYTEYNFEGMDDYKYNSKDSIGNAKVNLQQDYGYNITNQTISNMIELLKKYLFEYKAESYPEKNEDDEYNFASTTDFANRINNKGDVTYFNTISQGSDEYANRKQAYEMYISNLLLTKKAAGEVKTSEQVLFEEVSRIYKNYYENYLYSNYSNYIRSLIQYETVAGEANPYYALSDANIVLRYLLLLGKDEHSYQIEENYIAVVEAKATDTLLLYYYEGEYYYFSVQHLLIGFDDEIKEKLGEIYGNNASNDDRFYDIYKKIRKDFYNYVTDSTGHKLNSWMDYKNAIYRDENGYDVYITTSYTGDQTAKDENGNLIYVTSDGKFLYKDADVKVAQGDDKNSGYYWAKEVEANVTAGTNQKLIETESKYILRTYLTNAEFAATTKDDKILKSVISNLGGNVSDTLVYFDKDYIVKLPDKEDKYQDYISGYYFDIKVNAKPKYVDANFQKLIDNKDGTYTVRTYLLNTLFEACKNDTVTVQQVLDEFNDTYKLIIDELKKGGTAEAIRESLENLQEQKQINYVISEDLIKAYLNATDKEETCNKIFANLFMQHTFKYSADSASLETSLKNYVGMIISDQGDNHTVGGGSYVSEFTDGARALMQEYINNGNKNGDANRKLTDANFVYSDYGIHVIIINDVFKGGKVTGESLSYDTVFGEGADTEAQVQAAVEIMKNTYVCQASSQTLYQYVYELIREEMVGSNGTLLNTVRNNLYYEYTHGGDKYLKYYNKLSYDELMDALD